MDDSTFRVQFGGDGVAKLRDIVKEKLKEYMGDYSDDTLVEYVIVLLKNGRRKEEAKNELNVFLGDDSDSFIYWLWDHLQSNIDLYVQPEKSCPDEASRPKSTSGEPVKRSDLHHLYSEPEKENPNKLSKRRNTKDWKGLVRDAHEPPPLRSTVIANIHMEEGVNQVIDQAKRSLSPRLATHRKRSRPSERPQLGGVVPKNGASRRLLQFAVRDAVATSRPSSLTTEMSLKRLRSIVSASTDDFPLEGRPRSVSKVSNTMAVAIKAVAEAAKDVVKVKHSGKTTDHLTEYREPIIEYDGGYIGFDQAQEENHSTYHLLPRKNGQIVGNMSMLESDAGVCSDSVSDNEDFDNASIRGRSAMDITETGNSGLNKDNSLMVQYNIVNRVDKTPQDPSNVQDQVSIDKTPQDPSNVQDQVAAAATATATVNVSSKLVNAPSDVNTWKQYHYQKPRESELENQKLVQENEPGTGRSGTHSMKENGNPVIVINENAVIVEALRESQKTLPSAGIYATGRPTEDADSRTIFVSNVHFAATKDSLSRHFNKFGELLKVVIVTDAATGQPKGLAYVEFMRKEAAEHALSLDGASFMSRILKVVWKSVVQQEASTPTVTWPPHVARGSSFGVSRFAKRVPYPRGMFSMYPPRLSIKPGAKSLQWKRGDALASTNPIPSPTGRSLTYVRTEPKTNRDSGTA